jgi:hypothetical protein
LIEENAKRIAKKSLAECLGLRVQFSKGKRAGFIETGVSPACGSSGAL